MKKPSEETSSEKENKKVQTDKQFDDNEVREGKNNSIYNEENDKSAYPYKNESDKQYKKQSEFIDRNSDSKDKS